MATMATTLLVLLLAAPTVLGVNYKVGDAAGWETGVDYDTWASGKNFTVGDTLEFNYLPNHKVDEVSEGDYTACTKTNPLKSHGGTTVTIELTATGSRFFICPTSDHCSNGMKLQVSVVSSSGGNTPPTAASPPPPSGSGSSSPPTTSDTSSPPPPPSSPSGAWRTSVCGMDVIGVSVVFATLLLAFMG